MLRLAVGAPSDYSAFDLLDIPILGVADRKLAYANEAMCRLVGAPPAAFLGLELGTSGRSRLLTDEGALTPQQVMDALEEGRTLPRELWVELRTPAGLTRIAFRASRGRRPGEWIMTLLDTPHAVEARRLKEAMISVAPEIMRCKTEAQVLERATRVLSEHGLFCTFMFIRGDELVHGPMFQDQKELTAVEAIYGRPMTEVSFPRDALPHLEASLRTRRATFHDDVFTIVRRIHPPKVVAHMEQTLPHVPALDAPIFVGDQPHGLLAVMGPGLTPATAVSIELFVQLVGSAIEGARHAVAAENQLQELKRLQRELLDRERLATLGQAGAVVAHEVRNPLGAIINAVAVLRRDRALRGDSHHVVQVIEEEAHRLDRLVGDLLAFARPMEPRPIECDVYDVAQRVVASVTHERTDVSIAVAQNEALRLVHVDPDLLVLAVRNLVRNGVQASPTGGTVRVELFTDDRGAHISVHDEGPGVSPPDSEGDFAPFFNTRAMGTGLGLSVVHRVATAHDGAVRVGRSRYGGAEFTLDLPARSS